MSVLERTDSPGLYVYWCPGCGYCHHIKTKEYNTDPAHHPQWEWNGDMDKPTCSPSFLIGGAKRCHSFIHDGKIEYLQDCDHDLKGTTVDMADMDTLEEIAQRNSLRCAKGD
jgi:hypothetical protein